ncbi:MAG: TolC family protein [Planctomycetes bacterium]|nr:TolC family protein [Planctomycetota bacterium]
MKIRARISHSSALLTAVFLTGLSTSRLEAQDSAAKAQGKTQGTLRITLEEAKQRALSNSKLLNLAALNVESKEFAIRAARADYFPKVTGSIFYFHFNDDLGTVLTGGGRTVTGPRGRPLVTFPTFSVNAAVLNQNSNFTTIGAAQPITDLLKVRQGVKIAQADRGIAQAQLEKGIRDLASGVEQLYWGLLAVRRIQIGAQEGLRGAEMLAKTKALEARIALVEACQGLQQVKKQVADLEEQLNDLLDLPRCTIVELVAPALPELPYSCVDDVIGLALAASPEIREAQQTIGKAEAAVAAGKLDYVPSVALVGGYMNQTAADYMQPNIGYVGVVGTYTFLDWGKRRSVLRERRTFVAMANLKLQQTEDEIKQKTAKAFREVIDSRNDLKTAQEMVELRTEAAKKAATPDAARDPSALLKASAARMQAEVDLVKADLAYRQAYVQLMALVENPCGQVSFSTHSIATQGRQ